MSDNVGKGSDVDLTMTSDKQHVWLIIIQLKSFLKIKKDNKTHAAVAIDPLCLETAE
jgi:hypothetical protein